jgi:hypothetical protein
MTTPNRTTHIRLTSHPEPGTSTHRFPLRWGAATAKERGPVIGSVTSPGDRNVIGAHGGAYSLYRALAISARAMNPLARPDLTNTHPTAGIGPHPSWFDPDRIVSLDPWGHMAGEVFADEIASGVDIRPTIAVTKARLNVPEILAAMGAKRLAADGTVLHASGDISVTKVAVDPVWHLPGIARRFAVSESTLRRTLFEQTGGMYPELVTRPDMNVFLPPIGGATSTSWARSRRSPTTGAASPAGSTTSATARTCSAPTSAPAALTSCTASRNACARPRPAARA